ncbi:hypothetical protein Bbelb_033510 [Branchiostoma belcheri]|nr:hypothetical protein Bbelb_033510 [Branchiostoma belcheri]
MEAADDEGSPVSLGEEEPGLSDDNEDDADDALLEEEDPADNSDVSDGELNSPENVIENISDDSDQEADSSAVNGTSAQQQAPVVREAEESVTHGERREAVESSNERRDVGAQDVGSSTSPSDLIDLAFSLPDQSDSSQVPVVGSDSTDQAPDQSESGGQKADQSVVEPSGVSIDQYACDSADQSGHDAADQSDSVTTAQSEGTVADQSDGSRAEQSGVADQSDRVSADQSVGSTAKVLLNVDHVTADQSDAATPVLDEHEAELDYDEDVEEHTSVHGGEEPDQPEPDTSNKLGQEDKEEGDEEKKEATDNGEKSEEGEDDDDGELGEDDDLEEGEVKDPSGRKPLQRSLCRFYVKGAYSMIDRYQNQFGGPGILGPHPMGPNMWAAPVHAEEDMPPPPVVEPPVESAWERGLRHAKELRKKAMQRKEQDEDFEDKRMNLSLPEEEFDNNKENDFFRRQASRTEGHFGFQEEEPDYPFEPPPPDQYWQPGQYENFSVRWTREPEPHYTVHRAAEPSPTGGKQRQVCVPGKGCGTDDGIVGPGLCPLLKEEAPDLQWLKDHLADLETTGQIVRDKKGDQTGQTGPTVPTVRRGQRPQHRGCEQTSGRIPGAGRSLQKVVRPLLGAVGRGDAEEGGRRLADHLSSRSISPSPERKTSQSPKKKEATEKEGAAEKKPPTVAKKEVSSEKTSKAPPPKAKEKTANQKKGPEPPAKKPAEAKSGAKPVSSTKKASERKSLKDKPVSPKKDRTSRSPSLSDTNSEDSLSPSLSDSDSELSRSLSRTPSRSGSESRSSLSRSRSRSRSRSVSASSVSSRSSSLSSSISSISADSENLYGNMASPISSASSRSPLPARRKKINPRSHQPSRLRKADLQSRRTPHDSVHPLHLVTLVDADPRPAAEKPPESKKRAPPEKEKSPPAKKARPAPTPSPTKTAERRPSAGSRPETKRPLTPPGEPPSPKEPRRQPPAQKAAPAGKPAAKPPAEKPAEKKSTLSRREELLKQLKAVEDAIARKRKKMQ